MKRKSISIDEESEKILKGLGGKNVSKFLRDLIKGRVTINKKYEKINKK